MKIRPVGAEMAHAGGRTDGHGEANSRFSQFCEHAKKTLLLGVRLSVCISRPFPTQYIRGRCEINSSV